MIDAGYAVMKVAPNPFRDKAPGVVDICSVSDCVSHRPENWINSWLHNGLGWFNNAADAAHMIPEGEEELYRLFAYRLHPEYFRNGKALEVHVPDDVAPEPMPAGFESRGFDAVSRSLPSTAGFDCSPLSCNDMAADLDANAHCLFRTVDAAITAARRFSVEQPEPGDYYVIEVLEGRFRYDEPPAWEFGPLIDTNIAMNEMHEHPAIALLKEDVGATLGPAYAGRVDARARLLLPFGDWPQEAFAAKLIDDVQQEVHATFVDTTWPHCPAHPNHPLWFESGAWRCGTSGDAVAALGDLGTVLFNDAIEGLRRGDFSRLAPLFEQAEDRESVIMRWHAEGRFADHPSELAEALSCACFLGRERIAGALITKGVEVAGGSGTGLDAVHWAANRGQLDTLRMLIALGAPLETVNMHGTTVLGTAVWSAINEPKPRHVEIVRALLDAGANLDGAAYPTGHPEIDRMLEKHGAGGRT